MLWSKDTEWLVGLKKKQTFRSDKMDFKTEAVTKDKEENYIIIKESIQIEDITFINTYGLNIGTTKYIKHILRDKGRNWK